MNPLCLALILCLLPISIANAECAWVLWLRVSKNPVLKEQGKWELKKAFQTYQQCQDFKNKEIHDAAENYRRRKVGEVTVTRGESIYVVETANKEITSFFEYSCLPDTIDPRK